MASLSTKDSSRGQVLVAVLLALMVLGITLPLLVWFSQTESKSSVKQSHNTFAFNLAEVGQEKGYRMVASEPQNRTNIANGQDLVGYMFDKSYNDVPGGVYTIAIASGPASGQITVISVGRDNVSKQMRTIKAVYH